MKIAIHQPQYLPWIGYFDKLDRADIFVLLDDVQYKKNEWQNRNRIKTAGSVQWMTVPVRFRFPQMIRDVKIAHEHNWRKKHDHALTANYNHALYFDRYRDFFRNVYLRNWNHLLDLNLHIIAYLMEKLGIQTRIVLSSRLKIREKRSDRLIAICQALGGKEYLSGPGAKVYLDLEAFKNRGIQVKFQDFHHPRYGQLFNGGGNPGFVPNLSIIDLLFNCGDESLARIRQSNDRIEE